MMLLILCSIFPDAPIYTLFYDKNATGGVFEGRDVRTSFLQNLPFVKKYHRGFPLMMPLAVEQFDFSNFDVVVSISASFAKGIITKPHTKHICICLTPPRFLWDDSQKFVEEFGYSTLIQKILPPFISYLRVWDREASYRVDEFWAISDFIRQRIKKYYGRDSELVYPPVDVSKFPKPTTYPSTRAKHGTGHGNLPQYQSETRYGAWQPTPTPQEVYPLTTNQIEGGPPAGQATYFLMVGRLVAYKRFDLGVKAFNKLGFPLKIAGTGPELKKLKRMANDNIEFLGIVSDDRLVDLYSKAQALIFPQEEDFGIVSLEAMASGRPVIAFRSGGARETIIENKTGIFFDEQTINSLAYAIKNFDSSKFNPENCRKQAEKFDVGVFRSKIVEKIKI